MDENTRRYIKNRFVKYYLNMDLELPPRFTKREFGFMFFDSQMIRHIGFNRESELKKYIINKIPLHSYYSTAYYKYPERGMKEKVWEGADLIFDLDADHIEGVDKSDFETMLKIIKDEVMKLIDDFLVHDFGFDYDDLQITFSGNRGYHVHVRNDAVYQLKSSDRREIVNYISANNIDLDRFMHIFKEDKYSPVKKILYKPSEFGWYGKISKGIQNFSKELIETYDKEGKDGVKKILQGISTRMKTLLIDELFENRLDYSDMKNLRKIDVLASDSVRKLEIFKNENRRDAFLDVVKKNLIVTLSSEIDEPVTTDIHRLIRLPGSIHGKTGLLTKTIKDMDVLKEFIPLRDAICPTFMNETVKIILNRKLELRMNDEKFKLEEGTQELPEYIAMFLICKGFAEYEKAINHLT